MIITSRRDQRSLARGAGASLIWRAHPPRTHIAVSSSPHQDAVSKPHRPSSSSPLVTSSQRPRTRPCSYMRKPRAFRLIGTGGRLQTSGPADGFLLGTHSRTARALLRLPLDSRRVRGQESSVMSPVETSDAAHKRTGGISLPPRTASARSSGKIQRRVWPSQSCSGGPYHPRMREGRRVQRRTQPRCSGGKRTACNSFFEARICVNDTLKYGVMVVELVLRRPLKDTRTVVPLNSLPPDTFC